jgi:glycosyltransferase involved in cell wall biosynthesis
LSASETQSSSNERSHSNLTAPPASADATNSRGEKKKIALVIPVRDEADNIRTLIKSIRAQTRTPDEIILVDGGSRDGTIEILREVCVEDHRFRLLTATDAMPGQARNIGVADASFAWIAFTDAGNRLEPDWLEQLETVADSDDETAIVLGNFTPITDSFFTECAAITYLQPHLHDDVTDPSIASSLVRRDVWDVVGGFPDLRAAEDLIFLEEARAKGFRILAAPKATVHWELQPNLSRTFRRFFVYSRVNVWAHRQKYWHYGIARLYAFGLPFIVLGLWRGPIWLLGLVAGLSLRVLTRLWSNRQHHSLFWLLNPLRFIGVAVITLTIDLATFCGWISARLNLTRAREINLHLNSRTGVPK